MSLEAVGHKLADNMRARKRNADALLALRLVLYGFMLGAGIPFLAAILVGR